MTTGKKKVSSQWLQWLEAETSSWKETGIISQEQAGKILAGYEIPADKGQEQSSRLITLLAVLGSLMLGIGAILFFAANWQSLPKAFKLTLIFSAVIIAYGSGWWLAYEKKTYPRVGRALVFLGSIFYGSGIWLTAQIFHINIYFPTGLLLWAAGIIPVAYLTLSLPILVKSSLLLMLWTFHVQLQSANKVNLLFLPLAAFLFFLAYKKKSRLAVGLLLAGVSLWLFLAGLSYAESFVLFMIITLGLLIFSSAHLQQHYGREEMNVPYRIVGLALFLLLSFVMTFDGFVREFSYIEAFSFADAAFFYVAYAIVILLSFAAGTLTLLKARAEGISRLLEGAWVLLATGVVFAFSLSTSLDNTVYLLLTNIFLFIAIVTVIISGYYNREELMVNIGLVSFVLFVVARYFDFFWDMLDRSVFFMLGGLLLLIGGFLLERNRRKIIQEMSEGDEA